MSQRSSDEGFNISQLYFQTAALYIFTAYFKVPKVFFNFSLYSSCLET